MKGIFILFLISLCCCKKSITPSKFKNQSLKDINVSVKKDSTNYVFQDSIKKYQKLPIGSKLIIEHSFPKLWNYPSEFSSNDENRKPNTNNQILLKINKECEGVLSNREKEEISFNITEFDKFINYDDFLKKNINYLAHSNLPNLGLYKVILTWSKSFEKNIELLNLIVLNKQNDQLISGINLYYSKAGDLHNSSRVFYVDSNYNIFIKEFEVYDDGTSSEELKKYVITNQGKIISN